MRFISNELINLYLPLPACQHLKHILHVPTVFRSCKSHRTERIPNLSAVLPCEPQLSADGQPVCLPSAMPAWDV